MNNNVYGVILAGGKGERLWPLSREHTPKQLLSISNKTLLEHTKERIVGVIPEENIAVVTIAEQQQAITNILGPHLHMIVEPYAKNTAAAILLSCLTIANQDPNAVMVFFPADHFIGDLPKFHAALQKIINYCLMNDSIALLGIKPTSQQRDMVIWICTS